MYKRYVKRVLDIIIGISALPFVITAICLFGPIIYFTDKGTVFYKAQRIGKGGKVFDMYKLRTMVMNAPDIRIENGDTYNSDEDTRVTRIGKFLRSSSIDEIPQFMNILNGTMSLIGPRPDTPDFLQDYKNKYPNILELRPGITGYNQAFYRNSIDGETKMANDAYYADNINFRFDMIIFFKTFKTVIFRHNLNHKDICKKNF